MAKFHIVFASGKTETVEQSECSTVEQFINVRFGRGIDPSKFGTKVTLDGEEKKPVAVKKPAVTKAK